MFSQLEQEKLGMVKLRSELYKLNNENAIKEFIDLVLQQNEAVLNSSDIDASIDNALHEGSEKRQAEELKVIQQDSKSLACRELSVLPHVLQQMRLSEWRNA